MTKVPRSQLRLEKILEFVNFGGFYGDQPVSGQKVICQSLDDPNLRYEVYIRNYYWHNAKHTGLFTKMVTPSRVRIVYIDDSLKYAELNPGRYHCKLIEYVRRDSYVVSLGDVVSLPIKPGETAFLKYGGEGCGKVIWVYWKNGKPYARYCTHNCTYSLTHGPPEATFDRELKYSAGAATVPIRNVSTTVWLSTTEKATCTFSWNAPTNTRIDVIYVATKVIDEFDLNVPAPAKQEEQPKPQPQQPQPQPGQPPESFADFVQRLVEFFWRILPQPPGFWRQEGGD